MAATGERDERHERHERQQRHGHHHHLSRDEVREVAVEALGGTPADAQRAPVSPLRVVVPPSVSRRVAQIDRLVDGWFEEIRGRPVADRLFYGASALGDFSLIWLVAGTANALRPERDLRALARLGAALGVESLLVNVGVKSLFRRTRPDWYEHPLRRLRRPRTSSFPSGHATSGFMAASLLADEDGPGWPAWYALAVVVAASRVHVKIHHASDVLAGAAVGLVLGRIARRIVRL